MDIRFGKIQATNMAYSSHEKQGASSGSMHNPFQEHHEHNHNEKKQEKNNTFSPRLNDLDSNILEYKAYNNLSDEMLKLEQKISNLEQSISKIDKDINTLNSLGYDIQLPALKEQRSKLIAELEQLNKEYESKNFGAKFSSGITSALKKSSINPSFMTKFKDYIKQNLLTKMSKRFSYSQNMKEALSYLTDINSSIDELIKLRIPYGEDEERYKKLTAYLNHANQIHTQLSSKINSM